MNDIAKSGYKRMTVQEVAEALGVHPETIKTWVRKLWPGAMEVGKTTYLTEAQVATVKLKIGTGRNDLQNVLQVRNIETELEMLVMDAKVSEWKNRKIAELSRENDILRIEKAEAAPKLEAHAALMVSERTLSVTDASKHFGLHPRREVFPYLRATGYLTKKDLPTQDAIDAGYLVVRELQGYDEEVRPVARVLVSQLDTWRLRVVPQVKAWMEKV